MNTDRTFFLKQSFVFTFCFLYFCANYMCLKRKKSEDAFQVRKLVRRLRTKNKITKVTRHCLQTCRLVRLLSLDYDGVGKLKT